MNGKVTLRDIAREAGLSITAVSLVLNNRPNKLSAASCAAIRSAAARLGYVGAQQRRDRAAKRIGIVVPNLTNFFFASLIDGADSVTAASGHELILAFTANDPAREQREVRALYAQGIDGLIITTTTATDGRGYRQMFQKGSVPVILVDRVHHSFSYSSMTYNHQKGAYFAVRHLLELGHTRIACLSGDGEHSASASMRVQGYRLAHEESALPAPEGGIFAGDYLEDSGYAAADEIFARGFSALFSCNDMMAYGFYKRARELNRRIPGDISVVGYDDLFLSNLLDPPLTTVRQDPHALGQAAVRRLLLEMSDPSVPHQDTNIEPTLIVRHSTRLLRGATPT